MSRSRDHEVVCYATSQTISSKIRRADSSREGPIRNASLPHDPERDALQKKIRQLAIVVHMNEWMTSP